MKRAFGRRIAVAVLAACALVPAPAAESGDAEDGTVASAPTKDVIAKLGDADKAVRSAAADELVQRGAAAVPELVAALADGTRRGAAIGVIERIGPAAAGAVQALADLVRSPSAAPRGAVLRALGAIGAGAAPATSVLVPVISKASKRDRIEAMDAVSRILTSLAESSPRPLTGAETTIAAGCDWLVRHQEADGRWDCDSFSKRCKERTCGAPGAAEHDVGVTGLAVLALLGAGDASDAASRAASDRAVRFLQAAQDESGFVGPKSAADAVYDHACASLALAEAYRSSKREDLRPAVESAVRFILSVQNQDLGGWRYALAAGGECDTSVTTWMARTLISASKAGIDVDPRGVGGALTWIDSMTEPEFGRTGYRERGGPSSRTRSMQQKFPASESGALTACSLLVRLEAGRDPRKDRMIDIQADRLRKFLPAWDEDSGVIDLYYWMHGSMAMHLLPSGDPRATHWRKCLLLALQPSQRPAGDGCARGSWNPEDPWGPAGGRIYATVAAMLALEPCVDTSESRRTLPPGHEPVIDVLIAALADGTPEVAEAASRTIRAIRSVYRW